MSFRDRDEGEIPRIIIERERGSGLGPFFFGALLGAGMALLFAPRSGKETQEQIRVRAEEWKSAAEERMKEYQSSIEDRLSDARDGLRDRMDSVRDAVDTGRQAAREARDELEGRIERSKDAYRAGLDAARETHSGEGAEGPGSGGDGGSTVEGPDGERSGA